MAESRIASVNLPNMLTISLMVIIVITVIVLGHSSLSHFWKSPGSEQQNSQ